MGDEVDFEDAMIASAARTEVHLLNIREDVREVRKVLFGNGQPGVVIQTATQQTEIDELRADVVDLRDDQDAPEPDAVARKKGAAAMVHPCAVGLYPMNIIRHLKIILFL